MARTLTAAELRGAFSRFATGVTVVTYEVEGEPRGFTVNSFTSVSLDPPLALVSVARTAAAASRLAGARFAINVLSEDQEALALQFCGRQQDDLEIGWRMTPGQAPELDDVVAAYQCSGWQVVSAGDHDLHVAEVLSVRVEPEKSPLLFINGKFVTAATGFLLAG
ncbi:flavin reductase family protein [Geodermatophilus ruber]|uniref:NADH-FMN oxidoreductase RutF, flavin reductase (DIM6/NTAB) family n=1 Tax=Geodermatophilus ruber TaxID=504800 RepID=A0A1I4G1W7_9ACTN|nr:flavin reductase family protein [Geodermatophilus ruber]SFL24014.1 NADH-FMN oxidoreductase RutF, flavin reductase (DIM6/NTAB) family [Geodermatophilus ruber]